jgi:hypothetical protein
LSKRITVVFDDDVLKKLRNVQAEKIKQSQSFVSFSSVITDLLKKSSKNGKF